MTNRLALLSLLLGASAPLPAQDKLSGPIKLEDLERMALAANPSLRQAAADVRAAAGRRVQAGLYPNPALGATGDEIAGGPITRYGEFGGFFEQRIVTGGKLGKRRDVARQAEAAAEAGAEAQKYRVRNAVRSLYYQALGAQRLIQVREELARLARHAVDISRELYNVGQADQPDLLAAQIEAERADLSLTAARNDRERAWRQLAAVVNNPSLQPAPLEGDLEKVPSLDLEQALAKIYGESPELRQLQVLTRSAELAVRRANAEKIPDITVRGGVRYNRELLERGLSAPAPVGREGFFDVGVEIPIFNRNQGNVAAAKAEAERARLEVESARLALRRRLAAVYKEYQDAMTAAGRYRTLMIPKAQQSYDLYLRSFRQMAAAYPQVLIAQRNLFQLQEDYVAALVSAWQSSVEIQGLLLEE